MNTNMSDVERELYRSRKKQATRIYREVRSTLSDASLVSLYGSRVPIKNGAI